MNRISRWLNHLEKKGIDKASVLANTGLSIDNLGNVRLKPAQYRALLRNIVRLSPPGIGFELGSLSNIADMGVLGYAALSSKTMHDAAAILRKYYSLTEIAAAYREEIVGGDLIITQASSFPMVDLQPFHIEELLTRSIKDSEAYTGIAHRYKRIDCAYDEPAYVDQYRARFDCPLRFGQKENVWLIDASHRDLPVKHSNPEVAQLCETQCAKMLASQHHSHFGIMIRERLIFTPGKYPTAEEMAAQLNISAASLKRHLREEGESYGEIVDSLRKTFAIEYLTGSQLSLKEISYRLGFSNVHNFHRAFKRWMEVTPSQFRENSNST